MVKKKQLANVPRLDELIREVRGQKVMFDSDLARVYGVTTKRLNEQFRRNRKRFPEDFAFQLTSKEYEALRSQNATTTQRNLRSQFATSRSHGGRRYRFDLEKIWESKRALHQQLIALPIAKKLEMLDALHQRALAIKNSRGIPESGKLQEQPPRYGNDESP